MAGSTVVSVALCTRNGQRFIAEQIDSILNQSVLPTEIVISDDASSDDTIPAAEAAVERWRAEHNGQAVEVRILSNAVPLGVAGNFEQAIAATTGEFIILADQDDVWRPDRVELALAAFDRRPDTLLVHADARLVDGEGHRLDDSLFSAYDVNAGVITAIREGRAFEVLARRTIVTGATTMIRRRLADLAMPFPSGWVHDEWLAIVASAFQGVAVIDEQIIDYRQHGGNAIGASTLSFLGKLRRMLEPRTDRNRRLLDRAGALADRFAVMPLLDVSFVEASAEMLAHEIARSALPAARIRRLVPVARELRTGRYSRFGRGPADAVRDLLQPV